MSDRADWQERLAKFFGYLLVVIAGLSTLGTIYDTLVGVSASTYAEAAIFYVLIAYALLTLADKRRRERLGQPVPQGTRTILDMSTAVLYTLVTFLALGAMDYALIKSPMSPESEVTMLNDLMIFDGVLIGFVALLISQDLRDLAGDAEQGKWPPGLRTTYFHKRRLVKRQSNLITFMLLVVGAFSSWLSIPFIGATANVGYIATPVQATILGIGMLFGRMIWYT